MISSLRIRQQTQPRTHDWCHASIVSNSMEIIHGWHRRKCPCGCDCVWVTERGRVKDKLKEKDRRKNGKNIKEYKPPSMAKGILIIERLYFFSVLFLVSKSKLQSLSVISSTFPTLLKQMNWFKESRLFCESHPELCEFKLILKRRHGGEIRKWKNQSYNY